MFKPNKSLGQNFLKNQNSIQTMIRQLDAKDGEIIVEIGPGLGAVTKYLIDNYGPHDINIKAIEIDIRFVDKLKSMFYMYKNFEVIADNILEWLPLFDPKDKEYKIIGSLPYNITSPILHSIVKANKLPKACVILIQKEVAEKITQEAPNSSYLSSFVQTFFEAKYIKKVDKGDFTPVPKVHGAIVKLIRREDIKIEKISEYENFLHKAYKHPRKMLNKVFYKDQLNRAEIKGNNRPHDYNWNDWVKFFKILN